MRTLALQKITERLDYFKHRAEHRAHRYLKDGAENHYEFVKAYMGEYMGYVKAMHDMECITDADFAEHCDKVMQIMDMYLQKIDKNFK